MHHFHKTKCKDDRKAFLHLSSLAFRFLENNFQRIEKENNMTNNSHKIASSEERNITNENKTISMEQRNLTSVNVKTISLREVLKKQGPRLRSGRLIFNLSF